MLSPRQAVLAVALVAVTAGAAATGCSAQSPAAPSRTGATDQVFTLALNADPGSLDPHASPLTAVQQLGLFLYDRLIHQDGEAFSAGLADKWSQDGKVVRFHVRSDVTCSDGEPLTAETVAANLNYVADTENGSPLTNLTIPAGSKATADAATSEVVLTTPEPAAFALQGVSDLPIVCARGLADRKLLTQGADGTGPYVLDSSVAGSTYALSLRPGYSWGPGGATTATAGLPAKVAVNVVTNETTTANLLLNGGLQAGIVAGTDVRRLQAAKLTRYSTSSVYGELFFNQSADSPLRPQAIRRGLVQALNLAELMSVSTSGLGSAPERLTGSSPCKQPTVTGNLPAQDVAAAKAALSPLSGKELTLRYQSKLGPAAATAVQLAVQQWAAAGVTVKAHGETDSQLLTSVFATGNFDIAWVPIDGQNPAQTQGYFSGPTPAKGGSNFANIQNSTYDSLAAQAGALVGNAGCDLWAKADSALVAGSDVVPFANVDYSWWSPASVSFKTGYHGVQPMSIRMSA
jgi:peptide/nickel transport system substrate-binding protein